MVCNGICGSLFIQIFKRNVQLFGLNTKSTKIKKRESQTEREKEKEERLKNEMLK